MNFMENINTTHHTLRFTEEHSTEEIYFLDVTIYKEGNTLQSRLYNKPTDAYLYLRHDSCHPAHNKRSIPYSQFITMRRIHSKPQEYETSANALEQQLIARKYPTKELRTSRTNAEKAVLQPTREKQNK